MQVKPNALLGVGLGALGLAALVSNAGAQPFVYNNSDLCLTFRMLPAENNEVVVNLGQASTYLNAAVGSRISIAGYASSQLTSPTFSSLDNLAWSVFGWYISGSTYQNYPAYTLWLTVPRTDPSVRSAAPSRHSSAYQVNTQGPMSSILANAAFISKAIGTSSTYNNATFVSESISGYSTHLMPNWMGSLANSSIGTLNDTWPDNNVENSTYLGFDGSGDVVRSDLYEIRPLDNGYGGKVVDPHTGSSGQAYYVGYFEFASDGSMAFVREAGGTTTPPPPPAPTLSVSRAGNVTTISFASANGATYTLFYTSAAGLTAPLSSWSSLPGTLSGNGNVQSFTDTTADGTRFYRVQAQ